MFHRILVAVVMTCWRRWAPVVALAVAATVALAWFAAGTLSLDTDESKLLSQDLQFRLAEKAMDKAFPDGGGDLVVVVDAPTPGEAEQAADALLARIRTRTDVIAAASRPPGTAFFHREGLLYLSVNELQSLSDRLVQAEPMLGTLARDPSLRGVLTALDMMVMGAEHGQVAPATVTPALRRFADTAASVQAGKPKALDWNQLMGSATPMSQPRALILVTPRPDFTALMPGAGATNAIRFDAARLGLTPANGYRVRFTGSVALTDDNFATVREGVEITTPLSLLAVAIILFAAVRSKRLVAIIFSTLAVGLSATAAFAAATVGTLNPISVAFAVMFVGIAVDFAIQFVIRYRDARHHKPDADSAMDSCARSIVAPLSLAAASTAVGFLSFLPTSYAGVSQLGLVAGGGMLIALVVDLTLLPAMLRLSRAPGEREDVGLPFGRPVDRFIQRHARAVVVAAGLLALLALGLSPFLKFDANPLDLQNPKAEAVSTLRDLASNPETSPYSISILAPNRQAATRLAARLDALPQVDHAVTLTTMVPEHQGDKLGILADLQDIYAPMLSPEARKPTPTLAETQAAMARSAQLLRSMTKDTSGEARRLAGLLDQIRAGGPAKIDAFSRAMLGGLPENLEMLTRMLTARRVTLADLPGDIVHEWQAGDGRVKVTAWPKGNMNDQHQLRRFVEAVQSVDANAVGMPVSVVEAGKAVVRSFVQAGATAMLAIALLLGLMLRRLLDAVLVVIPLVLGGLYTVLGCVAFGLAINFANIIALPLLLGIGVAFNIYFVVNWRGGVRDHLQTSTSRAVLFSSMTTASAFGSLAASPHVGTASMGELLFLSVALTVATTFLVLPAIFHLLPRVPQRG